MSMARSILLRMFGRPTGMLGRLGGVIMARTNRACAAEIIDALEIGPTDAILEIGFGPGVAIRLLTERAPDGHIAGIEASPEMVAQATARNKDAIKRGQVELRVGTAATLPFAANTFDKALAINSMQVWPDAVASLQEVRRVLKPGGILALAFTPHSGQQRSGLEDLVAAAGFAETQVAKRHANIFLRARKP
jgi:ubiquinone/menaquinone biosynthesis C-methylase UbiE